VAKYLLIETLFTFILANDISSQILIRFSMVFLDVAEGNGTSKVQTANKARIDRELPYNRSFFMRKFDALI